MKIYKLSYIMLMLAGLVMTSSCIRDEIPDCPPLRVKIAVKDKNYFNVDKVELEDRKSEDLPLKEYVPTLYWVLRDAATGEIVDASDLISVADDERTYTADIRQSLQHGKYVLTVWGGLENPEPLGEDPTTLDFHPDNSEGGDIYMTNDTLQYDAWHNDYTVELERTKGKLIIEKLDLPAEIKESEKSISGLFAKVDNEFKYTGETSVTSRMKIIPSPQIVTKTVLSPSLRENGSVLSLAFFGNNSDEIESALIPKNVNITMRRNELTVLRYVWVPEKMDFDIYMLVNDNWEKILKMEID